MIFDLSLKPMSDRVEMPTYGTDESAGFDVRAFLPDNMASLVLHPGGSYTMPLGFATAFRPGVGIMMIPRSGFGSQLLELRNTVGLIDADYRDEWVIKLRHKGVPGVDPPIVIVHGERIAQAVPVAILRAAFSVVESLPESRRSGGFGSTGTL